MSPASWARAWARSAACVALFAASALVSVRASAAEPPDEADLERYSPYERETIEAALATTGSTIDPEPEGKRLEAIDVITLDVFEPRDPVPELLRRPLNWVHATTRPRVVRREVLLDQGAPYARELAYETARNLRALPQLSLVLCLPVRGRAPETVRLLCVTKDVWSLRMNSNFRVTPRGLEFLLLQPSEINLFGQHHALAGSFVLEPEAFSVGGRYVVRRIGKSRLASAFSANAILNRASGDLEGSFGEFAYGQPLWSTRAEWAWGAQIAWENELTRRYVGASVASFDADATPGPDGIPFRYRSDVVAGELDATRSFGRGRKHDVTAGLGASRRVFRTEDLSAFAPAAAAEFVAESVPRSDVRLGPFVQYRTYSTRFLRTLNFNTLGLQEDYRLGPELVLRASFASAEALSSRNVVGLSAGLAHTEALGDGLARVAAEWTVDVQPERVSDAAVDATARIETPSFEVGRLVFDVRLLHRHRNYLNRRISLGGEGRLRGYPSQALFGKDLFAANFEFRSLPVEVLTVQLAAAAFFDVGDAFDGFEEFRPKRSVGAGLRMLFPQLDRTVTRIDVGVPVSAGPLPEGVRPVDVVVTLGQAFDMPNLETR